MCGHTHYSITEYFPDTQPTRALTTTACQPFSAVATHSREAPFCTAVMRSYCVPLPARMFTEPLPQTMRTRFVVGVSGASG